MRFPDLRLLVLTAVLLGTPLAAQIPELEPEPLRIRAAHSERWEQDGVDIVVATGDIRAWQGTSESPILEIFADRIVVWFTPLPADAEGNRRTRTEVYAEGNVRMYRTGRERWYYGGDRLAFDLSADRGYLVEAKAGGTTRTGKGVEVPLYFRAAEFRVLSRERAIATDAHVTTCDFGDPHYKVAVSKLEIVDLEGVKRVRAHEMVLYGMDVPFFYFPYAEASEDDTYLIKRVRVGNSNRMGTFGLTTWGDDLGSWGKWRFHADYRSKRGPATGLDLDWSDVDSWGNPYRGFLHSYYTRDHGEDRDGTDPPENRWRLRGRHRHEFPEGLRVDLELSRIRDRNFLEEFFEREAKEGKEQETIAFVRKGYDNHLAWGLARLRTNEFQTQTEYLPQFGHSVISEPVLDEHPVLENLLYTSESQAAFLKRQFDEQLDDPGDPDAFDDYQAFRFDTRHRLDYPFQLGFVRFTPFAEGRYTQYDRVADGEAKDRWAFSTGARASLNLWRVYDGVESDFFDVHRLMHVFSPEVRYENLVDASVDREDLLVFDSVESISPVQQFTFRATNRLKTRRYAEDHDRKRAERARRIAAGEATERERIEEAFVPEDPGSVADVLFWRVDLTYFPDPEDVGKENPWGILDYDLRIQPFRWMGVYSKLEWDFESDAVRSASVGTNFTGRALWRSDRPETIPSWYASVSLRHIRETSLVLIATFQYPLSPKWSILLSSQYDFENDTDLDSTFTIRRTFHRWIVDFNLSRDEGEDETSFTVGISTIGLGRAFGDEGGFSE